MKVTREDKRSEAQREVAQRRKVYARLVSDGRMTQQEADRRIAVMQEIAEDYRAPDLFNP